MMKGMTQQQLADAVGISEAYVCKIETGRAWPKKYINKIAEILGVSEKEITGNVDVLNMAI